mmetsp:Transcript_11779/g.27300  ORF Transcript_11779/g.27300 Transcript_11779/m.27300 type:complete len:147 (+) Transcript_11779:640-1080(+)
MPVVICACIALWKVLLCVSDPVTLVSRTHHCLAPQMSSRGGVLSKEGLTRLSWEIMDKRMLLQRKSCAVVAMRKRLVVVGGFGARNRHRRQGVPSMETYDTKSDQWSVSAFLLSSQKISCAVAIGDDSVPCWVEERATGPWNLSTC